MTYRFIRISGLRSIAALVSLGVLSLSACAEGPSGQAVAKAPPAPLPTEQYPLRAETRTNTLNFRVNQDGLSANQRRALDQLADRASWIDGDPVTLEVVTSGNPVAVSAGRTIVSYLISHHVAEDTVSSSNRRDQPDDVVTVNIVDYEAHVYDCNRSWENLAATRNNTPYKNFGCALAANLAAQIADPRDLESPAPATSADAERRSAVLDHYRKGEKTSSQTDDNAKGTVSQAIN